MNLVVGPYGDV